MNFNWKRAAIFGGLYIIGAASAYIMGHTACAHQHVDLDEQAKMVYDKSGNINYIHYIKEAFKDYIRMETDPLGTKELS